MKKFIIISLIFISSCKPEYIKINEKLVGSWKLSSFEYLDINNKKVYQNKNNYIISFTDDNKGVIKINGNDFNFAYDFGFEQFEDGYANCDIDVENNNLLPIESIGKVQVYWYKFLNKNTIEFYINKEFDFSNKQVINDVTYKFVKM